MCSQELMRDGYGLALHYWTVFDPLYPHDDRVPSSTEPTRSPASPRHSSKHAEPLPRRGSWRCKNVVWLEGVETSRSDLNQQSLEKQDGHRNQKTIRQCRSVHYASPIDRPGDRSNRLLVVGQLLVPGTREPSNDDGLTQTQAGPEAARVAERKRVVIFPVTRVATVARLQTNESRKQLASCRGIRQGPLRPLTSRHV
ncbi:unnamed protein product [Psylliodes chrysocephalus]|uniref:Uncharacterized protein n=1 Tax=Psylliodes chrysocephalus TaxID=3402493 RepID=A0A9P0CLR3_9CUCU|nr:unnamed protein product [Psylliodes chrysocephala]